MERPKIGLLSEEPPQKIIIVRQPRQTSCCGCSCVVPTFVIPALAAVLWLPLGAFGVALAIPFGIASMHALAFADRLLRERSSQGQKATSA